jgi:hypothetical protein
VNPDSALRAEAKQRGWEIRDFRTGRKAARIGIPAAVGVGAAAGAVAAGIAARRRSRAAGRRRLPDLRVPYRQVERRWISNRYSVL